MIRPDRTADSMASARLVGGACIRAVMASGDGMPTVGSPVVDMIEHSDRTRAGWRITMACTIIPPMDTPTMWAASIPRASSRPIPSSAMSSTV